MRIENNNVSLLDIAPSSYKIHAIITNLMSIPQKACSHRTDRVAYQIKLNNTWANLLREGGRERKKERKRRVNSIVTTGDPMTVSDDYNYVQLWQHRVYM